MRQQRDRNNEQDDAVLVASVLAGEREAFDILLQRYASGVLHLCTRLFGNSIEAQDIAQEAALQAFLGLSHLREPERFAAWFHAIAANLARMALRRRRELPLHTLSDDDMPQTFWIDAPPTPEEYQMEREIQESILLELRNLSEVNRQAVIGFYLQGYSYQELAQILGVPVSTVKGRLFQGRKLLKMRLQPLAETLLRPIKGKRRKEKSMVTEDLIELHFDTMRRLILTRQHLVVLRDTQTKRGLPVPLTSVEADNLEVAFRARQYGDELSLPQDTSQRLLESLGAQFQRVMINALAGQTLYATITIVQGTQTHKVDMRLSEALSLAVRMKAPIFITRPLFEAAATLDLTTQTSLPSQDELEARGKDISKVGRQERLQWEEAVHSTIAAYQSRRTEEFSGRLWAWLIESLTGARENIAAAELRALDLATSFPTREVTWDEQPMVAIQLPDRRETGWLLVPPLVWEKITRQLQGLRRPGQKKERTPGTAPSLPDILPLEILQRAEEKLAQLVEMAEVRTVFLLNPRGIVSACKGPDTQEALQRYCDNRDDLDGPDGPRSLANEHEILSQIGPQPQNISAVPYIDRRAIKQEQREEISARRHDSGRMVLGINNSWRMVVFGDREMKEEKRHQVHQLFRELRDILLQSVSSSSETIQKEEQQE
ncbi:MAG TPA: bifunctional nuclease domain-containing protein [Ktedonobacteraceae bacterium]|nr:bifunctional nuclease domain-containing protein [Ktedonobacteraceae bacterium]